MTGKHPAPPESSAGKPNPTFSWAALAVVVAALAIGWLAGSFYSPGSDASALNAALRVSPSNPIPGSFVDLVFTLTEDGKPASGLREFNGGELHVAIARKNLSSLEVEFAEPDPDVRGVYRLKHAFPETGLFFVWVQFENRGKTGTKRFEVQIGNEPVESYDFERNFTIAKVFENRYLVTLMPRGELANGSKVTLNAHVEDLHLIRPANDLTPLNGSGMHAFVVAEDASSFAHLIPESEAKESELATGPDVEFSYAFPKKGVFNVWLQFKHSGKVVTSNFQLNVS